MAENSKIEWTDHTFNPWIGCTKVSPGCDHCYAEARMDHRLGQVRWGPHGERRRTGEAYWREPLKWNRRAADAGQRERVFCASLADVFDNQILSDWRADLWALIESTPNLDWLLLTKRPQNIAAMLPANWGDGWPNVWLGTTAENQTEADRRIPHLLARRATVRFVSAEPLLGPIDFTAIGPRLDWIIVGGESGPGARPMHPDWARSIRDQCAAAGVPFFFKQHGDWLATSDDNGEISYGSHPRHGWDIDGPTEAWAYRVGKTRAGRLLDGIEHNAMPEARP